MGTAVTVPVPPSDFEKARVTVEYIRYRIDENRRADSEEMQHYEVVEGPDSDRSAASSRTT